MTTEFAEHRRTSIRTLLVDAATTRPRQVRKGPRRSTAVIAAVAIFGGGVSIAAAAGANLLPDSVLDVLGWQQVDGAYSADPATGRLLLTTDGPHGRPVQLWYADASDNGFCVTDVELLGGTSTTPPASSTVPDWNADEVRGLAGGCSGPRSGIGWQSFGGAGFSTSAPPPEQYKGFIIHVPDVASVRLAFDDGTSRALPLADDWTTGWVDATEYAKHPDLVGYDANGAELHRVSLGSYFPR